MGEWKEYKLGDAPIEIIDGDRGKNYPKKDEFYENGYCLFLNTKNVTTSGFSFTELNFITKEKDKLLRKGKLKRYDLVLTTRGTVGNVGFYNDNVIYDKLRINSGMVIIRPNGIDKEFNYQLFKYLKKDFESFTTGSAQPQLPIRDLNEMPFLLPSLPEQKAIASVLSSLDDKIDLLHRQNKTLEAMAETLFRQWFVEEAQEDWEVVKLHSLINISSGKGLKKEHLSENGTYPVLGANGEIGRTNDFLFDESLLFTGRVGTLGNIFRIENEKVWLSDNTLVIKPKNYFNFIYFVLKTAKLEEYNVGSTQPLIRQSLNKIRQNKSQIRTLEKLRDTLLPKLMSGEVRVEH
jgi:type I restriction enzyme S subunit